MRIVLHKLNPLPGGGDITAAGFCVFRAKTSTNSAQVDTTAQYFLADALGSVCQVTNPDGNIVLSKAYAAKRPIS